MVPSISLKLALLALATYTTSVLASDSVRILRADDVLLRPYAAIPHLSRRQTDGTGSSNNTDSPSPSGSLNMTEWDIETNAACISTLSSLDQSSNPSGTCICYNLPSLDTETGLFEADLRLFKVSEPRGDWEGVPPEDIMVSLRYNGATVSSVNANEMAGMGMVGKVAGIAKRASDPKLMKTYMFVGQIDNTKMTGNMTMAALEALVMPVLTLSVKNLSGRVLTTNVSSNEAAFLTGAFSQEVVMSDFSAAQAAVDEQLQGLKNGTVAFVLPGVQLMIFPIGLIITSVWLLIGVAAYGFGTYERMQYAEMYKRRQAVALPRGKTF